MRDIFILTVHLLTTIAKLLRKGGARSIVADSLLMKQQLMITRQHQRRSPRLTPLDRVLLGFWSLFLNSRQIVRALSLSDHLRC
ncbi:MAG: hypothetical protein ACJAY2_002631 [Pseudomonadales bacterium]|jgi:hypothetical protein